MSENGGSRQLAVVTGASSGIGFELAKVFGKNGFDLIVAAEDDELNTAARELGEIAPSVETVQVRKMAEPGSAEKS